MKHRALVIGAGRIGAGFKWHDDAYTHAGAYRALSDRVELVGFVEPDLERRVAANLKWQVPTYDNVPFALEALKPDIVSICSQPDDQRNVYEQIANSGWRGIRGIWQEKPFIKPFEMVDWPSVQVNYMRRADWEHRGIAVHDAGGRLIVYGKDDIHTRCHFEDLAKWWKCELDYRVFAGPCAYVYCSNPKAFPCHEGDGTFFFDNGGVDGGECFKAMLTNLLDHVDDSSKPLWSPVE